MPDDLPTLYLPSPDGATLAVFRKSAGPAPVLIIHGTFSTHQSCWRLNAHLARLGHDVWTFDWRGRGQSTAPDPAFDFEDIAHRDLNAVLAHIRHVTDGARIAIVGHSGGGLVAAMWMARNPKLAQDWIYANVMIAAQATEAAQLAAHRDKITQIAQWLEGKETAPAGSLGVGDAPESARLMRQWCQWNLSRAFVGVDGFGYLSALSAVDVPTLAMSATGDVFVAPPYGCRNLLVAFGSNHKEHRECGTVTGFSEDFDHGRIMNSSSARAEVWPILAEWISPHSTL